jgi:hypothetical protein
MLIIEIALGFLILRYWRWELLGAWRALRHMNLGAVGLVDDWTTLSIGSLPMPVARSARVTVTLKGA